MPILFIIAGIIGLSIKSYFGAQVALSVLLLVLGTVPLLFWLGAMIATLIGAMSLR